MQILSRSVKGKTIKLGALGVLLVAATMLTGCTKAGSVPEQSVNDKKEAGSITLNTDNGNATVQNDGQDNFNISGQENGNNFNLSNQLPQNWPADLPTPANATIITASAREDNDKGTIEYGASFNSQDSLSNLFSKLKQDLLSQGWQITDQVDGSNTSGLGFLTSVLEAKKGDNKATITMSAGLGADKNAVTAVVLGTYNK